ncbi:MAG: carbohydrate ABC transporter permease [Spirochaetota bacterium]
MQEVLKRLRKVPIYGVMIGLVLIWILPVWTSFLVSFKSAEDFVSQKFYEFPARVAFHENLKKIIDIYKIQEHIISSLLYSAVGAGIAILFASMAGYSIVRLRPKFNFLLFFIIYSGTIFPFQMYLIPVYKMYNTIGLYDTRQGMFLIYAAICIPFSLFVYRGYYTTIPREIEEAAKIDGCGPVRAFFQIFIPNSIAPTAVVALFQATWIWNDLLFGMILTRIQKIRPIMVALATMSGYGGGSIPYIMTGVIIASIPTIALFIWLRQYFISGMILSSAA